MTEIAVGFAGVLGLWIAAAGIRYLLIIFSQGPYAARWRQPDEQDLSIAVFLGDSITNATVSASYIKRLQKNPLLAHWRFRNGGKNCWKVPHLTAELDRLLCSQPQAVVLFIGTNDSYQEYRYFFWLNNEMREEHVRRCLNQFEEDLQELLRGIRERVGSTVPIAVVDIPPFGEERESEAVHLVKRFNAVLEKEAAGAGADMISVFQPMMQDLQEAEASGHVSRKTPVFIRIRATVVKSVLAFVFLFMPLDRVSRMNRFRLHTDFIHFNSRGADIMAKQIGEWLKVQEISR